MSNSKKTVLNVDGMTCPSCIRHVEGALRELDGIGSVEVRIKDALVLVEHDPGLATTAQMIEALSEAGYESRGAGAE